MSDAENTTEKQQKDLPGKPFKKGDPRINRDGRPKGSKNFKTLFEEAVKELAEEYEEADDAQKDIIHKGLQKAAEGDYRFFSYLIDRLHGKPTQKIEQEFTDNTERKAITDIYKDLYGQEDNQEDTPGEES